jgi:hypothetical protein
MIRSTRSRGTILGGVVASEVLPAQRQDSVTSLRSILLGVNQKVHQPLHLPRALPPLPPPLLLGNVGHLRLSEKMQALETNTEDGTMFKDAENVMTIAGGWVGLDLVMIRSTRSRGTILGGVVASEVLPAQRQDPVTSLRSIL